MAQPGRDPQARARQSQEVQLDQMRRIEFQAPTSPSADTWQTRYPPYFGPLNELDIRYLDGILAHLARQCGGNVHDREVVTVSSSRPHNAGPQYAAKNVVDLRANTHFHSDYHVGEILEERNNWICYDFKGRRIIPTHYSIRSRWNGNPGNHNLKSWCVETSVNGEEWVEIDHKENNIDLNGGNRIVLFEVNRREVCRLIRLVNLGKNWGNSEILVISAWEIFGTLLE
jgi:hypothetical protein